MTIEKRLKQIRHNLEAGTVSWGDLFYLQSHPEEALESGDTLLMEAAGIPESVAMEHAN